MQKMPFPKKLPQKTIPNATSLVRLDVFQHRGDLWI